MKAFHSSIEGAQHGAKGLSGFLKFSCNSGADGAQPSNFMVQSGNGFMAAAEIKKAFDQDRLKMDGLSCHCPFWVHGAAASAVMLNGPITRSVRPFIPKEVAAKSPTQILQWAEDYILAFFDLCAELGIKIVPMFWGPYGDPALYSGYPWGFWKGDGFDMVKEFRDQFVKMTQRIRDHANKLGIVLAHEIHPGTAACCADDFNALVSICDGDKCLGVNADPSHCWEGESWQIRFRKVGSRVYGCHVKNFTIIPGRPLRSMEPLWPGRAMQFTDLARGDLKLVRYAELMIEIGYPQRYCELMRTQSAPLVVEAESAFKDGDETSADGITYVKEVLCFSVAKGSFEDGMGEAEKPAEPAKTATETVAAGANMADDAPVAEAVGKVVGLPAQTGEHADPPATPAGNVPTPVGTTIVTKKPAPGHKIAPKCETVRINLPPRAPGATSNLGVSPFAVPLPPTPTAVPHATPATVESGPTAQEAAAAS